MKYIVSIDYKEFEFHDGISALHFAEMAFGRSADRIKVKIEIKEDSNA